MYLQNTGGEPATAHGGQFGGWGVHRGAREYVNRIYGQLADSVNSEGGGVSLDRHNFLLITLLKKKG